MIASTLAQAWRTYRTHFRLIATTVIVVWLPCELLSSYLSAFVFDPDDLARSFKVDRFLDNFIGIIATAGVIHIAITAPLGQPRSFSGALSVGCDSWGRMWWTRFLSGIVLVLSFLLLVIPGVYVATRLCFVEEVAVAERISGRAAMERSFEITKGIFWPTFGLLSLTILIVIVACAVLVVPAVFIFDLDHWLIDAGTSLVCDVIAAFATVCFACGYRTITDNAPANLHGEPPDLPPST